MELAELGTPGTHLCCKYWLIKADEGAASRSTDLQDCFFLGPAIALQLHKVANISGLRKRRRELVVLFHLDCQNAVAKDQPPATAESPVLRTVAVPHPCVYHDRDPKCPGAY